MVIPCVVSLSFQVAGFTWNRWPVSAGMGGRFVVESVAGLVRKTQSIAENHAGVARRGYRA